jgi:hypothetical protein
MHTVRVYWMCGWNITVGFGSVCLTMVGRLKYVRLSLCYLGPSFIEGQKFFV